MPKLKVGVLGCASIAERSVIPAFLELDQYDLVAVASRTREKAGQFAEKFGCEAVTGYENLVDDDRIDLMYMPLPTGLHEEWVTACLKNGKHVLAEKSLAIDHASAKNMVGTARENHLLLMENFMFQYHAQHAMVREMIADGAIGDIRVFRSSFGFPPLPVGNIRYDKHLGGGALLDAGAYTLKVSGLYLGDTLKVRGATLTSGKGYEVDTGGGAFLQNDKGQIAETAFGFSNFYQNNYEIWGTEGKITVERAFSKPPTLEAPVILEKQGLREEYKAPADNHFKSLLVELYSSLIEKNLDRHYNELLLQSELIDNVRRLSHSE